MTRMIDVDICIEKIKNLPITYDAETVQRCIEVLSNAPTIDAVPVDFLKSISSRMYGKERFFRQTNGTWYDREQADYISLEEMMDRIYQQIVELDDGGIATVPVKRGEWVEYPYCLCYEGALTEEDIACSSCGAVFNVIDNCTEKFKYCPNCGADMRGEE